jgi:hypothetical protein
MEEEMVEKEPKILQIQTTKTKVNKDKKPKTQKVKTK